MIRVIVIGKIKEKYVKDGVDDFLDRLSHYTKIEVIEVKDSNPKKEGEKILSLCKGKIIALCIEGNQYSSEKFAKFIKSINIDTDISFVIGGSEGLSSAVKNNAHLKLSLSSMTFTHEMARLLLLEQLYRAFTIIKGRKYHK